MAYEPIGYAFDAAIYCPDCTVARFGPRILETSEGFEDSEGNEPGAVFESDESDTPDHCDSCGTFLEGALTSDGYAYVIDRLTDTKVRWEDSTRETLRAWFDRYSDGFDDDDWRELAQAWSDRILGESCGRVAHDDS